jgi:hypothetical protein
MEVQMKTAYEVQDDMVPAITNLGDDRFSEEESDDDEDDDGDEVTDGTDLVRFTRVRLTAIFMQV